MASNTISGVTEVDRILDKNPEAVTRGILDMIEAALSGDIAEMAEARRAFQRLVGEGMAIADLMARRRVRIEVEKAEAGFRDEFIPIAPVPAVPFKKAIERLASRVPMDVDGAKEVARVYIEENGFAVAGKADLVVTERVQKIIISSLREGVSVVPLSKVISELTDWAEAYSETVYRTNVSSAYTAGRFAHAKDPEIRKVVAGLQYVAVTDSNVRRGRKVDHDENHLAAHGLRASADDPIWTLAAPPSGYRCRCRTRLVTRFEAKRKKWPMDDQGQLVRFEPPSFRNFSPHPNFVGGTVDIAGV